MCECARVRACVCSLNRNELVLDRQQDTAEPCGEEVVSGPLNTSRAEHRRLPVGPSALWNRLAPANQLLGPSPAPPQPPISKYWFHTYLQWGRGGPMRCQHHDLPERRRRGAERRKVEEADGWRCDSQQGLGGKRQGLGDWRRKHAGIVQTRIPCSPECKHVKARSTPRIRLFADAQLVGTCVGPVISPVSPAIVKAISSDHLSTLSPTHPQSFTLSLFSLRTDN